MKGFNFASLSQSSPWTCRACTRLSQLQTRCSEKPPQYSTKARKYPRPRRSRHIVLAASGVAGVGALAFTDDVKHAYEAFERTGRVMGTLALCINE
jgi:aarF domain-containing kinase